MRTECSDVPILFSKGASFEIISDFFLILTFIDSNDYNRFFKKQERGKKTEVTIYKTVTVPSLIYGNELVYRFLLERLTANCRHARWKSKDCKCHELVKKTKENLKIEFWFGHTVRMAESALVKTHLLGKRCKGRLE